VTGQVAADPPEYQQRHRAESFGAIADDYDRYRPSYPDELIRDLLAGGPHTVLDIGCGTGKAARLLSRRGLAVLGVEIDPQMAAVARQHGIDVEVGGFEQWDPRGRTFDLVTCAQAWHWIDPAVGLPKIARLVTPGGLFAPFWNFDHVSDEDAAAIDPVYREHAPQLVRETMRHQPSDRADEVRASGEFASVTTRVYEWQRSLPVDDYVGKLGTQSEYQLLGPRLDGLLAGLRRVLHERGPEVTVIGGTFVIRARTQP
jgi:SAM-dependent methyltransferase